MDSNDVHRRWTERSGAYSPEYYAYYGPNETSELLADAIDRFAGADPSILELGCSSGRHLAHLFEEGYEDVAGVEINEEAFDVMAETYPELSAAGTFYHDAIESVVREFDDDAFDVVYSVETLQHLHPESDWAFAELARVAGSLLVTVENEGDDERAETAEEGRADEPTVNYVDGEVPLYYRDWNDVFTGVGLTEVEAKSLDRDTFRAFVPE
ncbi:class I SAM-dependent methyltransferase [Halogeometricum sp. S1BR25-6]|uniref:Class I SAM-dependent methyltransferase n=1 Tax=Halogeometricum salsisoli TaxID=2950536 RepID=A0ABU2GIK4_9EURY|nr:class I SAM-dependent methyltransferase [Halogeometricum sp. S1BR25-6]MDS0300088.1 class I SAM-dependent methyltransferase [Halogeometricum sp. S1BR25-6]